MLLREQAGKDEKDMQRIVEEVLGDWMEYVAEVLQIKLLENFDKEVENDGSGWAQLKSSTNDYRLSQGYSAGHPILNMTGALREGLKVVFNRKIFELDVITEAHYSEGLDDGVIGKRGGGTISISPRRHLDFPVEMYDIPTLEAATNQSKFIDILKQRLNSEFYQPGYGLPI